MGNVKQDPLFPSPWVEGSLDNLEGGAQNVIPVHLLGKPLRVNVAPWPGSNPTPDTPETLMLMWDGEQVGELRQWVAPIAPDDFYVDIPLPYLKDDSTPALTYWVTAYNGAGRGSQPLTISLDRTGPALGGDRGALLFDDEVLTEGVTADYLEFHDDVLVAQVPDYHVFVPGDHLRWFWDAHLYEDYLVGEKVLEQGDFPVTLQIPGDIIRERGDGQRFVHYRLNDYAGNKSSPEEPKVVQLKVDTAPLPRDLGWPGISHATGGGQQVQLDPNLKLNYMRVKLPSGAVFPGERAEVFWGEPGSVGSYLATEESSDYPGEYEIPLHRVAPHSGKLLKVGFVVIDKHDRRHPSLPLNVNVLALTQGLPGPDVPLFPTSTVYLSEVPEDGLEITLKPWRYIHTDHRVTLVVSGTDEEDGENVAQEVLKAHALSLNEVEVGLGFDGTVKATKDFLRTLARNTLSVKVTVSFDQGQTTPASPNFPTLELLFRD